MASRWVEGDRVLAPWEPEFFYPATVRAVGKRGIMVEYDDGDEGLVPASSLRPIQIEVGAVVQARRVRHIKRYEWAEIIDVRGEHVRLRYHEDQGEDDMPIQYIRIPDPAAFPQTDPELLELYKEGDRVLAPWEPHFLYPATIRQIDATAGIAMIEYDDGDSGPVRVADLQPFDIEENTPAQARRVKFEKLYEMATVLAFAGERVTVRYQTDGHEEEMDVTYIRIPRAVRRA
jgi:hypothetical protein